MLTLPPGEVLIDRRLLVMPSVDFQATGVSNAPERHSLTHLNHVAGDSGYSSAGSEDGVIATEAVKVRLGMVVALLWVVVGTLVLGALIAGIVFGVDGILEFTRSSNVPEFATWGGAALVLAAVCTQGWYRDRREARQVHAA
jgi:hypothetical protein